MLERTVVGMTNVCFCLFRSLPSETSAHPGARPTAIGIILSRRRAMLVIEPWESCQ